MVRGARALPWTVLVMILASATIGDGQRRVPFVHGHPATPTGIPPLPLPEEPVEYDTAEGRIRVSVVAKGLVHPWSLAFLPDGNMLVTERVGRLRLIRNGVLDPQPIDGVPAVSPGGYSGLLDIALHPHFSENHFVYITYAKACCNGGSTLALARGRWDGKALADVTEIFVAGPDVGGGSRIAFGRDLTLFMTTSGDDTQVQSLNSYAGKVLRLQDDGSVPPDNPFVGRRDHKPEIYSFGHRNALGLAIHPPTGDIWQHEMGLNGGDKANVIKPGGNYGWPMVTFGRTYRGPWHSKHFWDERFERPVLIWIPSISPSGMTFYTGNRLPNWKGDLFVGGLRTGEIPETGHLERILLNPNMEELSRESLLVPLRQRIRDVRQGPDELLYVLTDGQDRTKLDFASREGAVLRIEPAPVSSSQGRD